MKSKSTRRKNAGRNMSDLPWDNNSWEVAAQIAARRPSDAMAAALGSSGPDTPLPLRASGPLPQLLIKTIIVPGDKTSEGVLIEAVALPWFEIIEEIIRKVGRDHRCRV